MICLILRVTIKLDKNVNIKINLNFSDKWGAAHFNCNLRIASIQSLFPSWSTIWRTMTHIWSCLLFNHVTKKLKTIWKSLWGRSKWWRACRYSRRPTNGSKWPWRWWSCRSVQDWQYCEQSCIKHPCIRRAEFKGSWTYGIDIMQRNPYEYFNIFMEKI